MSNLFNDITDWLQAQLRNTDTYKEVIKTGNEIQQTAQEQANQLAVAYAEKQLITYLPYVIAGVLIFLALRDKR